MDTRNGSALYNFASLNDAFFGRPRKDVRSDLKDFFDGDYETNAVSRNREQNFDQQGQGKSQWRHAFSFGGGAEFRVAPRVSLGLEFKYMFTGDDYIDGWYLGQAGAMTPQNDGLTFTNLHINFNL